MRVRLVNGRELWLEVAPRAGEDLPSLSRRISPAAEAAEVQEKILENPSSRTADGFFRVPFGKLSPELRVLALRRVFPEDRPDGNDWLHVARKSPLPLYDEGLWQVAFWFTGDGSHFDELLKANGWTAPELVLGQLVRIPGRLLDAAFVALPTSEDGSLSYGRDEQGAYAGYRLKPGEALYSAVVLRFTGRTAPDDVDALAKSIAKRSGIHQLNDIPAGWMVKIPLDVLEPEFLPPSDARRKSVENAVAAMEQELAARPPRPSKSTKRGLDGVVVILDPGHGGMDPGTMNHSIWEHDYVFDVASRLKRELEEHTGAKVFLTLDDPAKPGTPSKGDALEANHRRSVLTTPPFVADADGETAVAVNLRWYLANSLYRKLVKSGTDPDRIVFLSLHADARHPTLRGAMVYVPGATFRTGTMGFDSQTYLRFKEVREQPRVSFSSRDRLRSEAVSRKLAASIVKALRKMDLPVQPYQPVRARVIRGGDEWLPAVLRGNAVPTKVLVEMVNLNNADDASLLAHAADRDRLASALARALTDQYGSRARKSVGG